MTRKRYVAVIGAGEATSQAETAAREIGRLLAIEGFCLVTGGLGGTMRAACEGARSAGGHTLGLLPGLVRDQANEFVEFPLVTGLGQMRNFLVVANADVVIAVDGGWGTLSELALARKTGKTVIALGRYSTLEGVVPAASPDEAVDLAKRYFK
ncbi:Conserved hypothetical protein CHP00730 [Desulfovibrio sp. X2]|uniref:SLOG cluster 4 domain-containing protein n=1 Tax=Desulfovibrio sp. X2 TaxID=941449 RepID=UPI0003589880|nr:LOG family protein [Desulfovibrio sp. X2]EPR42294.1 Conserved hypothetical protein CHP00730 [Desulfovibrio sp. X2]